MQEAAKRVQEGGWVAAAEAEVVMEWVAVGPLEAARTAAAPQAGERTAMPAATMAMPEAARPEAAVTGCAGHLVAES